MLNVKVIVGSTRPGRFSELVIPWLTAELEKRSHLSVEVLDLRNYPLPFFDHAVSPAYITSGDYGNEVVNAWGQKIKEADAFIMITPEYNHAPSAILKNAIDSVYGEWNKKAVGFISYGSVGGARAVEQLRQVAVELHLASTRTAVHIHAPWNLRNQDGSLKDGALKDYEGSLTNMLNELEWWAGALKSAREAA
jgi:NAD(P)H-dependent FMN reductase